MENIAILNAKDRYDQLFPTAESKASAFDKLAKGYYYVNFGSMSKSDLDTLMFSIYIEQILNASEDDIATYSDYTLSKLLGITQSRVSSLKVKKELQYPYIGFSWEKSFARIIENYRYEDKKIKIFIPDKNLYYEIKNAIETAGGYVEVQLTSTLLQITPEFFVDLIMTVTQERDRDAVREKLKETLNEHKISTDDFDRKPIGEQLKGIAADVAVNVTIDLIASFIPVVGNVLGTSLKRIINDMKKGE